MPAATRVHNRRRLAAGLAALLLLLAVLPLSQLSWVAPVGAAPAASATLVVNEVDYRQPGGVDEAEFVEVKNVGTGDINLAGYDLALVDVNGNVYWREALAFTPTLLAAGDHYVLCDDAGKVPGCDRAIKGWTIQDVADSQSAANAVAIILRIGGVRPDLLIDSVAYDGVVPGTYNGLPWTETLPVTAGDDDSDPYVGISRAPDGNDNDVNSRDFDRRCITPGGATGAGEPPCQPPPTDTPTPTATAGPTRGPSPTPTDEPKPTATDDGSGILDLVVDDDGNEPDLLPGDSRCDAGLKCTLRAAIMEANRTNHPGPIRIRFSETMEIRVPPNNPLPALIRGKVILTGVNPGGPGGRARPAGAGPDQLPVVWLRGPGPGSSMVGLDLDDTAEVVVQGLLISGFGVGIWIHGGGSGNVVGVVPDGRDDNVEGNVIAENGQAQIRIGDASGNVIAGNRLGADIGQRSPGIAGVELTDGAASNLIGTRIVAGNRRGAPNHIQWRHRYGVWIRGGGTGDNYVAGNVIGAQLAQDGTDAGNGVGVVIAEGATANTIGGDGDGEGGVEEANLIAFNLTDGIQVDRLSVDNTVRGNMIRGNGQNGIRLARTNRGGTWLTANRITDNGAAAIAYVGDGYEPPRPEVAGVMNLGDGKWQARGQACGGCVVEVFSDPSDEARTFWGETNADGNGQWQLDGIAANDDTAVAATARGPNGDTSRLSSAAPMDAASLWRLHAVPPSSPRILRGGAVDRRYRLYNERRRPVPDAEVRFTPGGWRFPTDENGFLEVRIPADVAAAFLNRGMAFTVQAVARNDGLVHPVAWRPAMAVALEQPVATSPDIILDLSSLAADGLGALLRRPEGTFALAGPAVGLPDDVLGTAVRATWMAGDIAATCAAPVRLTGLAAGEALGAAWTASADVSFREGDFAWQENIARGGALYELKAGTETLEGELEIRAPIAAWNTGGAASGCEPPGEGAVMCGWLRDRACWVPIGSSATSAPAPGAETVTVRAQVAVPPAGGATAAELTAGAVFTLYTVGFDVTPPVITPTISSGALLRELPPVLADAVDEHAGVNAKDGVEVLLDGMSVAVVYDPVTRQILVPEASRSLPPGARGPAELIIRVTDGFCNSAQSVTAVVFDPDAAPTETPPLTSTAPPTTTGTPPAPRTSTPTATPSPTPTLGSETPKPPLGKLYLPFCHQRR